MLWYAYIIVRWLMALYSFCFLIGNHLCFPSQLHQQPVSWQDILDPFQTTLSVKTEGWLQKFGLVRSHKYGFRQQIVRISILFYRMLPFHCANKFVCSGNPKRNGHAAKIPYLNVFKCYAIEQKLTKYICSEQDQNFGDPLIPVTVTAPGPARAPLSCWPSLQVR